MKKCQIEWCENKHYAKGYCDKHYQRLINYGDVNIACSRDADKAFKPAPRTVRTETHVLAIRADGLAWVLVRVSDGVLVARDRYAEWMPPRVLKDRASRRLRYGESLRVEGGLPVLYNRYDGLRDGESPARVAPLLRGGNRPHTTHILAFDDAGVKWILIRVSDGRVGPRGVHAKGKPHNETKDILRAKGYLAKTDTVKLDIGALFYEGIYPEQLKNWPILLGD